MNQSAEMVEDPRSASAQESSDGVVSIIQNSFFGGGIIDRADPVHSAYLHHFRVGGGGARVKLTLRCAEILGVAAHDRSCLAAAVECLHNASLVQDDFQDGSVFRRGQSSVFAEFGGDVALGLTNRLITTAFVCLSRLDQSACIGQLIPRLNDAVAETTTGQTLELVSTEHELSLDSRISAARQKSGPLFALALELPLIMAGEESHVKAAYDAACLFGLGYQIFDDLKDQSTDLANGQNSSLVLAVKSKEPDRTADGAAVHLALSFLKDAGQKAAALPYGMGQPLIELIDGLAPKIKTFAS